MTKTILDEQGRTFSEYSLMPGYKPQDCILQNIRLDTCLAGLHMGIPLLSAAMTSVTGYELALALGKLGGIGVLPARLPIEEQSGIVRAIKEYEMSFVEDPLTVRETATIEDVLNTVKMHGHSKIPVVDRNNLLLGMFTMQNYWETSPHPTERVTSSIIPFGDMIPYCNSPDLSVEQAKQELNQRSTDYLVVLDEHNRVVKLAFANDIEKIKVGCAISTYPGWQERVKANLSEGADLIVIDTSDAYSEFCKDVITEYRKSGAAPPICAGNIITREGALFLMEAGADIVKVGMSSGSICTTQREKAVGRAPISALIDVARAREEYFAQTGKYVPLVMDGGITCAADMVIALTIADAIMLGGYFNHFLEAAGEKYDNEMKETRIESEMRYVATWGEGSLRAQNLYRYGHDSKRTFFPEGIEGRVQYLGRLKPKLKQDLLKVKAAMLNAGCFDLLQLRDKSVLELLSAASLKIVNEPHDVDRIGFYTTEQRT